MTAVVLVSFAPQDTSAGTALLASLERDGWQCRSTLTSPSAPGAPDDNDYAALVVLISRHALESPFVIRDTERAVSRDVPVLPVRLDAAPLSRAFDYFVGCIGAASVPRHGLDAVSEQVGAALHRHLASGISAPDPAHVRAPVTFQPAAPPFRGQRLLRRSIDIAGAATLITAVAALAFEISALSGYSSNLTIRTLARLTIFLVNVYLWLLLVWLHGAHRNLLALGAISLPYTTKGMLWRLLAMPVSIVLAPGVLSELQRASTPPSQRPSPSWLLSWSWSAILVASPLHAFLEILPDDPRLWMVLLPGALLCMVGVVASRMLVARVTARQLAARAERTRSQVIDRDVTRAGRGLSVLVAGATEDHSAAVGIAEALTSRGLNCRLARRDTSWNAREVDAGDAVVVMVSAHLADSIQTYEELERAVAMHLVILPFRLDHSPVPPRFRYLLGSLHWLDDQGSGLDEQIELLARSLPMTPEPVLADAGGLQRSMGRPDVGAGARLTGRPRGDPLRFVSQDAALHWIANLAFSGTAVSLLTLGADRAWVEDIEIGPPESTEAIASLMSLSVFQVMAVLLPISIVFVVWLAGAYRNLSALGVPTRHPTARAVRALLNPFINVFLAIPVVLDLWKSSLPTTERSTARQWRAVWLWWGFVLLYWSTYWSRAVAILGPSPALLLWSDVAACVFFAVASWLTYRLAATVSALQARKRLQSR